MHKYIASRGVGGYTPQEDFFTIRSSEIASETSFGPKSWYVESAVLPAVAFVYSIP